MHAARWIVVLAITCGLSRAAAADPCTAGADAERAGKLPLAQVLLGRCAAGTGAGASGATTALTRVSRQLAAGDYAPVVFSIEPVTAELRIAGPLADEPIAEPFEVWLPFGTHAYAVTAPGRDPVRGQVVVDGRDRQLIPVRLPITATPGGSIAEVDFGEDGPAVDSPIVQPDPRPKKHRSLIPKRWLGSDPSAGVVFDSGGTRRAPRRARPPRPRPRALPWTLTWGL
jgi:hypothetical protein